jgi:hypothetical protein
MDASPDASARARSYIHRDRSGGPRCRDTSCSARSRRCSTSRSQRRNRCRRLTECNAEEYVTSLHSSVSEDEGTTFCVYDASTPKAIRKTAHRNELPVDQIIQVRVPDPYFYA